MLPIFALGAMTLLGSCASKQAPAETPALVKAPQGPVIGGPVKALPKALVYKMTGDYAQNVPVQVNAAGEIVSFPAPSDVKGQEPIELRGGWWLDRRGVSANSVFTTYTYAAYSALSAAPTVAELKAAIIPGARVIDLRQLPMLPSEAAADTAAVNRLVSQF